MIPLFHDFEGESILVVGGGPVGARKARRFAREARVVVLSPTFDGEFGAVEKVRASVAPDDVDAWLDRVEPRLVVAATDDTELNDALEAAARERDLLVNRTDESGARESHSVVVPATIRDGPVVLALSTSGRSPALSRYLREQLESELEHAGAMAELTGELRTQLKESERSPAARREAIRSVVKSQEVWTALDSGSANASAVAADVLAADAGERS